jgi:hypothetical protein
MFKLGGRRYVHSTMILSLKNEGTTENRCVRSDGASQRAQCGKGCTLCERYSAECGLAAALRVKASRVGLTHPQKGLGSARGGEKKSPA